MSERDEQRRWLERECKLSRLAASVLEVKESGTGMGAFARGAFQRGAVIVDWTRYPRCSLEGLPNPYTKDCHVQVAPDLFVGSSVPPGPDDFINHSCEPNSSIVVELPKILLVALRDIRPGEEVTFDYAETMYDDPWEMRCDCGTASCRGIIREPDKRVSKR